MQELAATRLSHLGARPGGVGDRVSCVVHGARPPPRTILNPGEEQQQAPQRRRRVHRLGTGAARDDVDSALELGPRSAELSIADERRRELR